MVHGANRDVCACGSTVPPRRVRVRGGVDPGVPRGRSRRRRAALLDRVPRSYRDVSCGRGCIRARGHAGARCRMPRQLGARTGSPYAPRPSLRSPASRRPQGRAGRVVRAVLPHTVRCSSHGGGASSRVQICDVRREPLRRDVGLGLGARCRERVARVAVTPGERPQPAVPARRGCAGSCERSPRRR